MKECSSCGSCFSDEVEICEQDNQPVRLTLRIESLVNDRYQLVRRLGNGSASVVYLALDRFSKVNHAVKIIPPDFIESRKTAERFLSEATAPSALHHPNIIEITDSGLIGELLPFVVMEFIDGSSLHESLASHGPLEPQLALEYVSTIARALGAAHKRQIVHGDLKPRSILIKPDLPITAAIKTSDFGNATIKSAKLQKTMGAKSSRLLRSPLYLAPEEFSEEISDYRSDIYSLGVILYEMLAGEAPFQGKSIPSIMKRHLMDAPPPIEGRFPNLTNEIERVVMHALEKDPQQRPDSMDEFVAEFENAVHGVVPKETIPSPELDATVAMSGIERHAASEESTDVDLDQTIVFVNPRTTSKNEAITATVTTPELAESDLDMTILPGMIKLATDEPGELVQQTSSPNNVAEEIVPDVFELSNEEPVQRSVSPILLALGVLVFVVLIALGVYYSRLSQ